jgi:predicted DCC family thiol-disulfide oxidoreductase YuxK
MSQIIFFDGVCLLCNGFVDFLLKRDLEGHFKFAPLQGEQAKALVPQNMREGMDTVVLWSQGQVFTRSEAALMILTQLGGLWWFTRVGWLVPLVLRDFVYKFVSRRRYAWFGKSDPCRLPTGAERGRFME